MALNARQKALYRDLVNIYRPTTPTSTTSTGTKKDPLFELATENVKCKFYPNNTVSNLTKIGRVQSDAKAELELFHFEAGTAVRDTYIVQLKTPGHPDYDKWFVIVGDPEQRPSSGVRRSNYCEATARRRAVGPILAP